MEENDIARCPKMSSEVSTLLWKEKIHIGFHCEMRFHFRYFKSNSPTTTEVTTALNCYSMGLGKAENTPWLLISRATHEIEALRGANPWILNVRSKTWRCIIGICQAYSWANWQTPDRNLSGSQSWQLSLQEVFSVCPKIPRLVFSCERISCYVVHIF